MTCSFIRQPPFHINTKVNFKGGCLTQVLLYKCLQYWIIQKGGGINKTSLIKLLYRMIKFWREYVKWHFIPLLSEWMDCTWRFSRHVFTRETASCPHCTEWPTTWTRPLVVIYQRKETYNYAKTTEPSALYTILFSSFWKSSWRNSSHSLRRSLQRGKWVQSGKKPHRADIQFTDPL